ncbi:MAG: hypothetical protein KDB22_25595 [Planctomycetales bacterium]|nr:hypothetical protein [Planctomycetales bacterium]
MIVVRVVSILILTFASYSAFAQGQGGRCGSLANGFGPYDYRADRGKTDGSGTYEHKLWLVESTHFTPPVEALIKGQTTSQPGGDIDYTLRAFPNHHRALMAVMRLGEKTSPQRPVGLRYDYDCYLERAVRFAPDDPIARMIYATYLGKANRMNEAAQHLDLATTLAADNPFTHYNLGLIFHDLKMYDKSLARAHRAIELGFGRTELRDLLIAAGKWQDAPPAPSKQQN